VPLVMEVVVNAAVEERSRNPPEGSNARRSRCALAWRCPDVFEPDIARGI